MMNPLQTLAALWRKPDNRRAVAASYSALGHHPQLLADIALRGGLYSRSGALSLEQANYAAGRRDLAREILDLAQADPARVQHFIEKIEVKPEPTR